MAYIEVASIVDKDRAMSGRHFGSFCVAALLAALQFGASSAPAATPDTYDPWPGLVQDIFSNRPMDDAAGVLALEMPARAEDAAIVPVTLRVKLPPTDTRRIRTITLVIDQIRRRWRRALSLDRFPQCLKSPPASASTATPMSMRSPN